MKNYLVIDFTIQPPEAGRDIVLALLDVEGYDSFEESETGLKAYILADEFDPDALQALPFFNSEEFTVSYTTDRLENKNWNEEWETFYDPIDIDGKVLIRAPFHDDPQKDYLHQVIIMPKMSFGTGHHQTTRLMSRLVLQMEMEGKKVLDMGTGTGILAILASQRKAAHVLAVDNFEWAVENTRENIERNPCGKVEARLGDADILPGLYFDTVLANINRNVLLEDMKTYIDTLPIGGDLALSGFFQDDFAAIHQEATAHGMELVTRLTEDRWTATHYKKTKAH